VAAKLTWRHAGNESGQIENGAGIRLGLQPRSPNANSCDRPGSRALSVMCDEFVEKSWLFFGVTA